MSIARLKNGGWPFASPPNCDFEVNYASPQARGLVGWWSMLHDHRETAQRDLVRRNELAVSGTLEWSPHSRMGGGLYFTNGVPDYLEGVPSQQLFADNPFTLAGWGALDTPTSWTPHVIGAVTDPDVGFNRGAYIAIDCRNNANVLRAWGFAGATVTTTAFAARTHEPIHIALTINLADDIVVYGQGGLVSNTGIALTGPVNCDTVDIGIMFMNGARSYPMDGWVYDFRVWNRVLTAGEIWSLYNPDTRWDLYRPQVRWWQGSAVPVSGLSVPVAMHHYMHQN